MFPLCSTHVLFRRQAHFCAGRRGRGRLSVRRCVDVPMRAVMPTGLAVPVVDHPTCMMVMGGAPPRSPKQAVRNGVVRPGRPLRCVLAGDDGGGLGVAATRHLRTTVALRRGGDEVGGARAGVPAHRRRCRAHSGIECRAPGCAAKIQVVRLDAGPWSVVVLRQTGRRCAGRHDGRQQEPNMQSAVHIEPPRLLIIVWHPP